MHMVMHTSDFFCSAFALFWLYEELVLTIYKEEGIPSKTSSASRHCGKLVPGECYACLISWGAEGCP